MRLVVSPNRERRDGRATSVGRLESNLRKRKENASQAATSQNAGESKSVSALEESS